ncbi:MAG: hypothetical protein PHF67_00015 [Candidatus Nanoarchaeia archaeon]|nr:hypothetical protein [Candidatus Nanoarchaeia archaeon]
MAISEKKYDMFVISWVVVLLLLLLFFGSFSFIKEMKKNNAITGFVTSGDTNQTKPQEVYSIKSYTIFYLSVIFLIIAVAIISLILIVPKIKKYT